MKNAAPRLFSVFLLNFVFCLVVSAQTFQATQKNTTTLPKSSESTSSPTELEKIKQQLQEQQKEIEQLRSMLIQQAKIIETLQKPTAPTEQTSNSENQTAVKLPENQADDVETRLTKVEEQTKKTSNQIENGQFGKLGFSGDLRMQYDSQYGLLNNAVNVVDPTILGNELSSRQRIRFRLRFNVTGKIGGDVSTGAFASNGEKRMDKEFEWGFRLSGGSLANPASPNPVLTDFFSRKPFALDRAYVAWRPRPLPGLKIIVGKFEPNWIKTEMTIDNDVQVEGVGETFSRDIKNKFLKNITLSAWQLPMLERGTTFIRNADGTINLGESQRNGRDLGLFGGQIQTKFALSPNTNLTLSIADLNFAHTDAINPVQVFGNNLQLPVTITIPATATTPAQTVTGVATISRDLLVSGNGNLGLSAGTNAAVNRNGRLSSGFNLVDVIAQLDFKQNKYLPVSFLFNYVKNTQTRDVVVAGASGEDVFLPNNEGDGIWAEIQFKSLRKNRGQDFNSAVRGDLAFSYTYLRIEKDAVLSPFNWDDLLQPSDIQGHRLFFSYTADPRVTFNITGLFNNRLNGLLGAFRTTPAGSLDRDTIRIQVDTVFKF